jgi:alpha-tubulin suppressor-like RCC1 family protein
MIKYKTWAFFALIVFVFAFLTIMSTGNFGSEADAQEFVGGQVYSFGGGGVGQLGHGDRENQLLPKRIEALGNVKEVAASAEHSLAVTEKGELYSFGRNDYGQLGHGNKTSQLIPIKVATVGKVKKISAGSLHSLILLENGQVYSFGYNKLGQLGLGDFGQRLEPILIEGIPPVKDIASGAWHSLVLAEGGQVYSFGSNSEGQLGLGDSNNRNTPNLIDSINNAAAISAGDGHSMILLENGDVYSFGLNYRGQLGHGDNESSTRPAKIESVSKAKAITAGTQASFIILENGDLYSFGYNVHGRLGHGDTKDQSIPKKVVGITNVKAVAAGMRFTLALLENGQAYSFGSNYYGELGQGTSGLGDQNACLTPAGIASLKNIAMVAAGGHSLVIAGGDAGGQPSFPSAWAAPEIEDAKRYGLTTTKVLSNYQTPITREEFCELAVILYEVLSGQKAQSAPANTFNDTANTEILKAFQLGVVSGMGGGRFAPNDLITREQIAVMFYRITKLAKPGLKAPTSPPPDFMDSDQVSGWALAAVNDMSAREIISGVGKGKFDPKGNATREQAIALVKRVYDKMK